VNPALTGSLAAAGLLAGWPQRRLIIRLSDPPIPSAPPAPAAPGVQSSPDVRRPSARTRLPALLPGGVTAILFGALAIRVPGGADGLVLAAACWLAACAVPLAYADMAVQRLPDPLTGAAYAGTVVLLLLAAAVGGPWSALYPALLRALLGGLALAGFYLLLILISPSGMSLGDVKLAASLGSLLAWFSWRLLIAGGFAGLCLGALAAGALLASRRVGRKHLIPFGPFMIAGAVLAIIAWPR
jgi:leader peptidase (prepilin peptidase) / N-methyltransferase